MAQHGVSEMAKYDDMSFSKAFAAARKEMGKGKTFTWKGKSYTTDLKEEAAAKKPKSKAVTAPPPRPTTGTLIGGEPIAEMKPSSTKSQRTMSTRSRNKITETNLDKKSSGRGSGSDEAFTRRMQGAIDRAKAKSPKDYTYEQWKGMSRAERKAAGLPVSVIGGEMGFKRFRTGLTGREYTMSGK
jgi:hypothetical protein